MQQLVLSIHSIVDVITNSSSEIFVGFDEHSMKHVKDFIDAILKMSGTGKTCDDLFFVEKQTINNTSDWWYDPEDDEFGGYFPVPSKTIVITSKENNKESLDLLKHVQKFVEARRAFNQ